MGGITYAEVSLDSAAVVPSDADLYAMQYQLPSSPWLHPAWLIGHSH